jgi:S1-C subfamily serine protease
MRKTIGVLAVVVLVALAVTSWAGEKCTGTTQDCLNKMVKNLQNRGWVGIEMDDDAGDGTIVVTKVVEGSPAEMAGFKTGDVLLAVNGVEFSDANEQKLKDVQYAMVPGADFTYTVARSGSKVDLDVELGHIPDNVMAQWIGGHMMEHADVQMASAK